MAGYSGGAKFRNGDTIMARIIPCLENGKTTYVLILYDKEIGFEYEYVYGSSVARYYTELLYTDVVKDSLPNAMQ